MVSAAKRGERVGLIWWVAVGVVLLVGSSCGGSSTPVVKPGPRPPAVPSAAKGQWVAAEATGASGARETTIITSRDGRAWHEAKVLPGETVSGLAWGNGKWVAVANVDEIETTRVLESSDLRTWTQVETIRETLVSVAFGGGRWVAVGVDRAGIAVNGVQHATGVIYTSTDGRSWTKAIVDDRSMVAFESLASVAYNGKTWLATGTDGPGNAAPPAPSTLVAFSSADGTRWAGTGTRFAVADARASLTTHSDAWVLAAPPGTMPGITTSVDGRTWSQVFGTPFSSNNAVALAEGDGQLLGVDVANGPSLTSSFSGPSTFFSSGDVKTWTELTSVASPVTALAFGPAPAGGRVVDPVITSSSSTSTPTAPPSTTVTSGPSSAVGPPCTTAAVQASIPPGWSYRGTPFCVDAWAVISPTTPEGDDAVLLLRANGGVWVQAEDRSCDPALVPAAIYQRCAVS